MLDRVPPEGQMKFARFGLWGRRIEDFLTNIEAWREEESTKGMEVRV
jgi:hypothetical protein